MTETPSGPDATPSGDDVGALRAQLGELQRRNQELEAAGSADRGWKAVLRRIAVVVLVALGALFITASVPTIWGRNLVLNTDRYVETLKPLASNPGLQSAIVKAVDAQFARHVNIASTVAGVLPPRAAKLLSGPLENAASSLVNTVATKFVQSPQFQALWVTINRVAHTALVAILTGKHSANGALTIKNGILLLNLAPIITAVKARLVSAGLGVASLVPTVGVTIELLQLKGLTKAQSAVRLLNHAALYLPLLALVCFAGAILAARRRRRATIVCALVTAGGMLVIAIGVLIGRRIYLDNLPLKYLSANDAGAVFDTMVRFLRDGLRLVFAIALLICALIWLTGGSRQARGMRSHIMRGGRAIASRGSDWRYAGVVAENRRPISIGIAALGALILVLWTNPGVATVIVIALVTAALIVLVYSFSPPAVARPIP